MYQLKTRRFHIALSAVSVGSVLFLLLFAIFGKALASMSYQSASDCVFGVMVLAVSSFLLFSFSPYFKGDKRWFLISVLLTVVFFVGAAMLWQLPYPGEVH